MSKAKASAKLLPFDAARYLTDDAAIAEYITAVLETGDSDLVLLALCDVSAGHPVEKWPESFRIAFEGISENFERQLQARQKRESFDL